MSEGEFFTVPDNIDEYAKDAKLLGDEAFLAKLIEERERDKLEIAELKEKLNFYTKITEDFDGAVRYSMETVPQLKELLNRHMSYLKSNR